MKVTLEMALYVAKMDVERTKAELETIKLNQSLEAAQDMTKVGYWSYDFGADKYSWSSQMFTIFGYDPDEGVPTYEKRKESLHPDDHELFDNAVLG